MKFIVLVKQVPDTDEVRVDEETGTIVREGVPAILNPFDEYALNLALRVGKEVEEETEIVAVSMGPPQAEEALKKALAIGADEAYLLTDRAFGGADTWATSYTLYRAIETLDDPDLIFCGQEATDGNTAQVGPEVASHLGIPPLTYVEDIFELQPNQGKLTVKKETDEGFVKIQSGLPALVCCMTPPDFEPKIPGVKEIMKAKKKPLSQLTLEDLGGSPDQYGLEGSESQVVDTYPPQSKGAGVKFEGKPKEAAQKILELIEDQGVAND